MTINIIETMKQARGALVQCQQQLSSDWTHFTTATEAITNLCAAIDAAEKHEPVAKFAVTASGHYALVFSNDEIRTQQLKPGAAFYTHPAPIQHDSEQAKDAARYRMLRDWHCGGQKTDHPLVGPLLGLVQGRNKWPILASHFDIAIDAAMKVGAGGTAHVPETGFGDMAQTADYSASTHTNPTVKDSLTVGRTEAHS